MTGAGIAAVSLTGLLAACGDDDDDSSDAEPEATTGGGAPAAATSSGDAEATATSADGTSAPAGEDDDPAEAKSGGTLTIGRPSDAVGLDPKIETTSPGNWVMSNMYETLVVFTQESEFVPGLAESWEQVDESTWQFTLRQGVTFHDGTAFNGEAVKFSIDRQKDPDNPGRSASNLAPITEIRVVDDHTVDVVTDGPYGPLLHISRSSTQPGSSVPPPSRNMARTTFAIRLEPARSSSSSGRRTTTSRSSASRTTGATRHCSTKSSTALFRRKARGCCRSKPARSTW